MPNWCDNELYIFGTESEVQKVVDAIKGEDYEDWRTEQMMENPIEFRKIIPVPEEFKKWDEMMKAHNEEVQAIKDGMKMEDNTNPDWEEFKQELIDAGMVNHGGMGSTEDTPSIFLSDSFNTAIRVKGEEKPISWYYWNIKHWGTKWDACDPRVLEPMTLHNEEWYEDVKAEEPQELYRYAIGFDTAWSPPRQIIGRMSELFPNVTLLLKFWEGGMGFKGEFKVKAGNVIVNETIDYCGHTDPDGWRGG